MYIFTELELSLSLTVQVDPHNGMDANGYAVLKLFVVGLIVNAWMMGGLSATESFNIEPTSSRPRKACNESRLEWEVEVCGEAFKRDMAHIDPQHWCNLTHFISEYHLFTLCTETKSLTVHCYWPNPLVESYIIRIHKHFFSNCTMEQHLPIRPMPRAGPDLQRCIINA
ncbi:receptor activity-modifying protein 3-like isoform X2 [Nerophis lumbriciformis]|uniref:receptor activity-modifying protein 3-like isoform X2 n=1 Tax=Nerophis lumbriciformis TaxID=546530 RepID=UPI003BAC142B